MRSETVGDEIPVNVEKICEINDNKIIYRNLPGILGKREKNSDGTFSIIVDEKIKTDERRCRYTIGHELGHIYFETHHFSDYIKASKDVNNPNRNYISRKFENQLEIQFAAELLMPEQAFRGKIRKIKDLNGWHTISDLSKHFITSLYSTILRFTSFTSEICAFLVFNISGKFISLSYSEEFRENKFYIPRDCKIPDNSMAYEIFERKSNNKMSGLPPQTWCPSFKKY